MKFQPDTIYHIYNQGNNRQKIFACDDDYVLFLQMTRTLIKPHCEILAYCLMPSHFHYMIVTDNRSVITIQQGGNELDALTNGFRKLLSGYARIFNKKYGHSGSLFRQKTKTKILSVEVTGKASITPIENNLNCFHYIHLNPYKAGLVPKAEDWVYSSCREYALLRRGTLANMELAKKHCDYNTNGFLKEMYKRKDIEVGV
jgi:putative transposase